MLGGIMREDVFEDEPFLMGEEWWFSKEKHLAVVSKEP